METCEAVRRSESKNAFVKTIFFDTERTVCDLAAVRVGDAVVGSPRIAFYRTCMYFSPFTSIFMVDRSILCD
jgi:hypothetical protein